MPPMPMQMPMPGGAPPPPQQPPQVAPISSAPMGNSNVTIDQVMALLRDGTLRRFSIDIESDSMIAGDETQERQDRAEFVATVTKLVQGWAPIVAQTPQLLPMARELILFQVRAFRSASTMEDVIESSLEKLEELANSPKPPPPPSPEEMKAKAAAVKAQAEIAKANISAQQAQVEGELRVREAAVKHQSVLAEHGHDARQMLVEAELEAQRRAQELQIEREKAAMKMQEHAAAAMRRNVMPPPQGEF
jgi:hypothetical protein